MRGKEEERQSSTQELCENSINLTVFMENNQHCKQGIHTLAALSCVFKLKCYCKCHHVSHKLYLHS